VREKRYYDHTGREALAAAAMAFAPATEVPRERALIRSAIVSLLLNFGDSGFKRSEGIKAICGHGNLPELRVEIGQVLFDKLVSDNILQAEEPEQDGNFRFDAEFSKNAYAEQDRIDTLVDQVISDLFETGGLPHAVIPRLRKELLLVLARLMAEYGKEYAYQVAGRTEEPIVVQRKELVAICQRTMSQKMGEYVTSDKMADAITELFGRKEPHFAAFVFALTQNYYYLRLLGIGGGLEFFSEGRFGGSRFLLDTNMLLPFLLEESRHRRSVLELMEIAEQLNISLHETEITLEELRRVVQYNRTDLAKAFDEVPDELVPNTQSVLLRAYRARRRGEPNLTVQEFLGQFLDVRGTLENEWGVTVFDDPVERTIDSKELNRTEGIINESSVTVRHRKKGKASLEHDAHAYYVVLAERKRSGDKAAWLLTLDRSLPHAAKKLQPKGSVPFCMTLDGFLHIISPYVRADHQQSFAEMFVELVGNNLFAPEEVIEIEDFLMFTDFDLSVRQLPAVDVKKVIRRVKGALDGGVPLQSERERVAYEVQKALSDPTLKYRTALEEDLKQREAQIKALKEAQDRDREKHDLQVQRIESKQRAKLEELNRKLGAMAEKSKQYEVQMERILKKHKMAWFLFKAFLSLALLGGAVRGCWWFIDSQSNSVTDPLLCKVSVAVAAGAALVGIISPKRWLSVALFILAVLGFLYSAWVVFGR